VCMCWGWFLSIKETLVGLDNVLLPMGAHYLVCNTNDLS